jgi:hypothetical protein
MKTLNESVGTVGTVEYFPYSTDPGYRLLLAFRIAEHVAHAPRESLIVVPGLDAYSLYDELVVRTEGVRVEATSALIDCDWARGPLVLLWPDEDWRTAAAHLVQRSTSLLVVPWE